MKIKITEKNKERLYELISNIMNLATVAFGKGIIPNDKDIEYKERGSYWYRNSEKFSILSGAGNHFAYIYKETDTEIVLCFYSRYDNRNIEVPALLNLINAIWSEQTEIVDKNIIDY